MPGRSFVLALIAQLFVLLLFALFATQVVAQSTVVVLGVRSVEGDDDVAHDLTTALREGAQGISAWNVSPTAVSRSRSLGPGSKRSMPPASQTSPRFVRGPVVIGPLRRTRARGFDSR